MSEEKEIIVIPPQISELKDLSIISDLQYLEICSSEALNRKNLGINPAGIYRGFNHVIGDGLKITIGDDSGQNTAVVERNGVSLTIQQQKPIELVFASGKTSTAVIEGFYEYGTVTKQVDVNSEVDAAAIRVVDQAAVASHHVILFDVVIPTNATQITEPMIDLSRRMKAGLSAHESAANPHTQYVLKVDLDFGETF